MSVRGRICSAKGVDALDRLLGVGMVALAPGGLRALVAWKPRSAAAFRLTMAVARSGVVPATVIDIGANIGQFSRAAVGRWPATKIIAFEPLPFVADSLRQALGVLGDSHEVHQLALGASEGATVFHPHCYSLSSSVLPMASTSRHRFRWAAEGNAITVPLARLDDVLADVKLERPVLVKIDVQGYEPQVLAGAIRVLEVADLLVIEHAFEECYRGQPRAAAVMEYLMRSGWEVDRVVDVRREEGVIVEADVLYRRRRISAEDPR